MPNKALGLSPLSHSAESICKKRYYQKDKDGNPTENWEILVNRVVNSICKKEDDKFKKQIFDLIYHTKFLPNSPCLVNAGNNISGLTACFTSPPVHDSWLGMIKNIEIFGHIARRGGGNGVCLSYIRPEGDPVFGSTHAKACGPIEHMRMISEVMSSITQAGFRGMANLASMHINHPDIKKFITCKQHDRALKTLLKEDILNHYDKIKDSANNQLKVILDKFIHNFNISVIVSDDFMNKVKNDEDFDLVFNNKIYETVKARELFDLIVENAWKNGDPGLLFENSINDSPYKYSKQKITSTNPCVTGDTLVHTKKEPIPAKNIKKGDLICTQGKFYPVKHIEKNSNYKVFRVTFSNGQHVDATASHQFKCSEKNHEYQYKRVDDICVNDKVISEYIVEMATDQYYHKNKIVSVTSIEEQPGEHDVYDIYVEETDEWLTNGIVSRGCGEQPLPSSQGKGDNLGGWSGGTCNLGSIDVSKYYNKEEKDIDWRKLKSTIRVCIQFLDNVIDANKFPTNEFKKWAEENRPVGLGIMGWADLLIKLHIPYGSPKSLKKAEQLSSFLEEESHKMSVKLSKERGTPKACRFDELEHRRNITLTSIAPTGSISLLAGCSSSIEPIFSPIIYIKNNTGSFKQNHQEFNKSYFRCALDPTHKCKEVTWEEHVKMQAAFQKHCSSGVSKTCNLPSNATKQDVANVYMLAHKIHCKGITVYRDGSKTTQVLNTSDQNNNLQINNAPKRPKKVDADIHRTFANGFEWHVIVGKVNNSPYEVFAVNGSHKLPEEGIVIKNKKHNYSLLSKEGELIIENIVAEEENIHPQISLETRRFSMELRHGINPKFIVEQIDKSKDVVSSFAKAGGRILRKYMTEEENINSVVCPTCQKEGKGNGKMIFESGCFKCLVCHFSKCG